MYINTHIFTYWYKESSYRYKQNIYLLVKAYIQYSFIFIYLICTIGDNLKDRLKGLKKHEKLIKFWQIKLCCYIVSLWNLCLLSIFKNTSRCQENFNVFSNHHQVLLVIYSCQSLCHSVFSTNICSS